MEIFNVKKDNFDCSDNNYYFINDEALMCFSQGLNCDLTLSVNTYPNIEGKVSFIIDKKEFKDIYDLIHNMLEEIHRRKDVLGYNELFEKGYFSWKSDAPANEELWGTKDEFIYNYFNIIPMESAYILEMVNNTDNYIFCIEINTDRSRYERIRFDVFDFFKNLEHVCHEEDSNFLKEKVKKLKLSKINKK